MGALLFSHFRVTNVELINDKKFLKYYGFKMTWTTYVILLRFFVFSLLCCKYICDIYLSMLDFDGLCKFKTTYFLTRLPHAGLYDYNGRQIKLFHLE